MYDIPVRNTLGYYLIKNMGEYLESNFALKSRKGKKKQCL